MSKVLDVDSLLVNDEDIPGHTVSGVLECSEVERLGSLLARAQADQQHHQGGQHVRLADLSWRGYGVKQGMFTILTILNDSLEDS